MIVILGVLRKLDDNREQNNKKFKNIRAKTKAQI